MEALDFTVFSGAFFWSPFLGGCLKVCLVVSLGAFLPFSSEGKDWDNVTVAEVKEACCRATCQSVFASDATLSCDTHYVVDDDDHKD